jgi:predicted dehydrogenase
VTGRRRIGVGLISAGWMGAVHSHAYRALGERYPELDVDVVPVIVADTSAPNAEAARRRFGYRETTADYHEVLAHPEVDVVSICSPNYLHREHALAAAAAGKPFWVEKPMGTSVGQSQDIADAARDAGLVTAVGFNYRHAPAVEHLRSLVRSGRLGRVMNVRVVLDADYSSSPSGPRTWRFVRETAGSGVLGDLLSHGFDLAQYVVAPVREVTALTETFIRERPAPVGGGVGHQAHGDLDGELLPVENEDYAAVLARLDGGAVATFESSRVAVGPRCGYGIEVFGSLGTARWDFERMNELEVCLGPGDAGYGFTRVLTDGAHGEFGRFNPGGGMGLSFEDLKVIEGAQFIKSVLTGEQLAPSVADGLQAARVAAAAEASAADGRWHTVLPPGPPAGSDSVGRGVP